jgi:peroxiredoxin
MPHLQEIHEEYDAEGIRVVAVATDQQGAEIVRPFIEKNGYTFRVVPDAAQVVSRQFGSIRSIPTTFIIGPDGQVKNKFVGYQDKQVYLDAALAARES